MLPCFSYYKNVDNMKFNDLQIKKNFKYTIIHPYYPIMPYDFIPRVEVTLKMCTVYKGVPQGLAIISYKDKGLEWLSFEGVGVFTEG